MNDLRTSPFGDVDASAFAELSYEELRTWVRNRLHGLDLVVPSGRDDTSMPHFIIAAKYPTLNCSTRKDLQAIMFEFLQDLAHNPETEWRGFPGSELLMLADPILVDSDNRVDIIENLLRIADADRTSILGSDLKFRALQALVTLRHRANESYWVRQYNEGGDQYVPVVLEGLAIVDIASPFSWLAEIPWNVNVERAVIGFLPNLLEQYGAAKTTHAIEEILPTLRADTRDAILQFCKEEHLTLTIPITAIHAMTANEDSLIEVQTCKESSFTDSPHGYAITKGGKLVLQFHIYSEYYTIAWRCQSGFNPEPIKLKLHLRNCIYEIAPQLGIRRTAPSSPEDGFARINHGIGHYVRDIESLEMPFVVTPYHSSQKDAHDRNQAYLLHKPETFRFLRFDVEFDIPIILWASGLDSDRAEVGFSSRLMPKHLFVLFQEGRPDIFPDEVLVIQKILEPLIPPISHWQSLTSI